MSAEDVGEGLTEIDALELAEEVWEDEPTEAEQLLVQRVLLSDWFTGYLQRIVAEREAAAREQGRAEADAAWACMCGVSEADHASVDPPHMFHSQAERDDLSLTVAIEALAVRAVRYGSEYVPLSQLRALLTADHAKALAAVKAAAWDEGVDYCEDIAGVGYNPVGTHDANPYRLTTDTP